MRKHLKTALIGFGNIGCGLADDPLVKRYFQYATHAEVLKDHPDYLWECVVEIDPIKRDLAKRAWRIPYVFSSIDEMMENYHPDVAIFATLPDKRLEDLKKISTVKAIMFEKPIAYSLRDSREIYEFCDENNIHAQVNYWRRGDLLYYDYCYDKLQSLLGPINHVNAIYGNGIMNNGSHIIDFIRQLCGSIKSVQALSNCTAFSEGPIPNDLNYTVLLYIENGAPVFLRPVAFSKYREICLDIYGERGRLVIDQESLNIRFFPVKNHRSLSNTFEISNDDPTVFQSASSTALYELYTNLYDAVYSNSRLLSPLENSITVSNIIRHIQGSYDCGGKLVMLSEQ